MRMQVEMQCIRAKLGIKISGLCTAPQRECSFNPDAWVPPTPKPFKTQVGGIFLTGQVLPKGINNDWRSEAFLRTSHTAVW